MATRSSTLAWRIPGTEEPGRLQSRGPQKESSTTERLSAFAQSQKIPPQPIYLLSAAAPRPRLTPHAPRGSVLVTPTLGACVEQLCRSMA